MPFLGSTQSRILFNGCRYTGRYRLSMRITENSTPEEPEAPNPDTVGKFDIYHALSYTTDDILRFIDMVVSRAAAVRKDIIRLIVRMRGGTCRLPFYRKQSVRGNNTRRGALSLLKKIVLLRIIRSTGTLNRNTSSPPVIVCKRNVAGLLPNP